MKLLVVKTSALGDVVHALPVLPYLKSTDLGMEIDWLVEEPIAPLLKGHPSLRRVWKIRTREWRKIPFQGAREMLATGMALRRQRYDAVLDLQGNSKSGFFTWMAGASRRFGFDASGTREWPNRLATNHRVALTEHDCHVTDRSLAIARAACPGGSLPSHVGLLSITDADRRRVLEKMGELGLVQGKTVILHCGTTWVTKRWPPDNWLLLAEALGREFNVRPMLTWGNSEELSLAETIARTVGGARVWPGDGLTDLMALLEQADLVIGSDTGPVHIAAALGTATVSLYRATDAARNGPRGNRHIRLQSPLDCSPCLGKECSLDAECAHSIPVVDVLTAARKLLGR